MTMTTTEEQKAATNGNAIVPAEKPMAPVPITQGGVQIESLEALYRFAGYVAASGLAPKGLERKESILIAIEMGLEIGLKPMQALQNIAVINGRPAVWGDAVKALIEGSGLCEDFSEWYEGKAYDDDFKAICEIKRRGRTRPVRQEFSVEDAKRAGLWGKSGPWSTNPRRMLQMRARGFASRDAFPDILRGVVSREEAYDLPTVEAIEINGQAVEVERVPKARPRNVADLAEQLVKTDVQEVQEPAQDTPQDDAAPWDDAEVDVNPTTGEITQPEGGAALF